MRARIVFPGATDKAVRREFQTWAENSGVPPRHNHSQRGAINARNFFDTAESLAIKSVICSGVLP